MAVTAETRTGIIALSVAMLGEAPGTARLGDWVDSVDGGMTLEELANHIASSDAFQATYPNFSTNAEFAEDFLGNVLGDNVSAELMSAAEGIVVGLLNDGMTRGALALAVVSALHDIAMAGESHAAYGDLGMAAMAFANKVDVAEHYTLNARMADPSSDVLDGVTADADSVKMANDAIDNSSSTPEDMTGDSFSLARTRDNIKGTDYDDNFVADADEDGFATLNGFDTIDGGGGNDIMSVYDISTDPDIGEAEYDAQVSNIEHLEIFARGGIDANVSGWEGLEHVELEQFSRSGNVKITVDGATVGTDRTFGGNVTIVGAAGEVNVTAGKTSDIKVGSGAHTTSVMTKGGDTVDVNLNGAGGQSMTVTSVSLDLVTGEGLGGDGKRGNPMEAAPVTIAVGNVGLSPSATVTQYGTNDSGTFTPVTDANAAANMYYIAASQDINGATDGTGLSAGQVVVTTVYADASSSQGPMREQVFKDGERVDPGTEGAVSGRDSGGVPIHINSDAIEHVSLSNTYATIAVINQSDDAEDLMVTVNKYGSAAVAGKFCITGDGAAENVSIMVAGDSNFALANNATKTVSISGDANLTLDVTNFVGPPTNVDAGGANSPVASTTLESITSSGGGKLTMDVAGTTKLKTIDGSASSGGSSIKGVHDAVTTVDGGSGNDAVTAAGFHKDGLTVNLGAGNDVFTSAGGNSKSRVDGGEGADVLHLTGNSATHKVDGKDVSIFSNFEALEIGGSGAAAHDVGLLGVQTVSARASTISTVALNNMADGMGIDVIGKAGAAMVGTHAMITHSMKAREAGDRRYSGELDVSLHASGGAKDDKVNETGTAKLTLTADGEIEILNVASSASVGGSHASVAAKDKPSAASYKNELILMGASDGAGAAVASNVEVIVVSGDAMAMIGVASGGTGADATQFAALELIEAVDNTGGVIFNATVDIGGTATALTQELEMVGGAGMDDFTGGSGADKLMGGGGNDTLSGGAGIDTITGGAGADKLSGGTEADVFKYASASESQMGGYDTVTDWASGDTFSLGKTVFNGLHRGENIREVTVAAEIINSTDALADETARTDSDPTTNPTANSLKDWLGDGKDVFKTLTGTGLATDATQHAITTVNDTYWTTVPVADNPDTTADEEVAGVSATRTWVLIDVDADGDFDAATDMVILLSGGVGGTAFDLTDNGSDFTA